MASAACIKTEGVPVEFKCRHNFIGNNGAFSNASYNTRPLEFNINSTASANDHQ